MRDRNKRLWNEVDRLDRVNWSNDSELWNALPEPTRAVFDEGLDLYPDYKPQALARFEASAAMGNPVAMVWAGRLHACGTGTARDTERACEFFSDAIDAGSWNATLWYAREMHNLGHYDAAIETLEEGVEADHIPSFFWLAWLRYKQKRTRKEARAVLPLIEYAMNNNHPGATWMIGKLMMTGKLGLRRVPEGFRLALRHSNWFSAEEENAVGSTKTDDS